MFQKILFWLLFGITFLMAERIDITPSELEALQNQGVRVVDIRTEPEWQQTGVIPQSERLTFFDARGNYDALGFLKRLEQRRITPQTPLILVCRSGNRTLSVANYLSSQGFEKVYNLKNGIIEWIKLSKPLEKPAP